MPRYFFHLAGSGARDTGGLEYPNDEAARKEAAAVARGLSQKGNVVGDERIVVTDDDGKIIHEERLFRSR